MQSPINLEALPIGRKTSHPTNHPLWRSAKFDPKAGLSLAKVGTCKPAAVCMPQAESAEAIARCGLAPGARCSFVMIAHGQPRINRWPVQGALTATKLVVPAAAFA
mmetsp:Transcript_22838/g.65909  ORF Transcript_22838/g.65909 Transcript_22838/m.65909 type:complete len:106 (+) Transcript_22838:399-716(+)